MMCLAGRRHFYASVLHHKGRHSGKEYATPLGVAPIDGGFVIPLDYGEGVDWLKNVLAEGEARTPNTANATTPHRRYAMETQKVG